MWKTIAIIVGWIVLAFILIQIAFHVIGMFMLLAMVVGVALLIGAPILFFIKQRSQTPQAIVEESESKLYEPNGAIRLFAQEPTASQIIMIGGEAKDGPKFIEIPNDTIIKILQDDDKTAVKVKIISGASKGKTGWVSRGAVIKSTKTR